MAEHGSVKEKRRATLLRQQTALLSLASAQAAGLETFIPRALKTDADLLNVERVSFWRFEKAPDVLRRVLLYVRSLDAFEGGQVIHKSDFPSYFEALHRDYIISTADARVDVRTRELRADYLEAFGITSMLDVPVWSNGQLAGVLCHEHVGPVRAWRSHEEALAFSVGQLLSGALEVDERSRVESELWESEEQLRLFSSNVTDYTLVRMMPDGTIFTGPQRVHVTTPADLTGQNFSIFYPPEDVKRGVPQQTLKRAEREGRFDEERWLLHSDGTRFWAQVTIVPVRDRLHRLRGFVKIARDLTAQRLAQENAELLEKTKAAEARARLLSNLSVSLSGTLDGEKNVGPLTQVLGAGIADAAVFHLEHIEGGVATFAPIFAEDVDPARKPVLDGWARSCVDEHECPPALTAVLTSRKTQRFEEPLEVRTNGGLGYRYTVCAPAMTSDRVVGVLTLMRRGGEPFSDQELALAEEIAHRLALCVDNSRLYRLAREAVELRDVFLSVAAHELRTPIAALILSLQSWAHDTELHVGTEESRQRKLDLALRQTRRLGALVDELMEVSRIGTGAVKLQTQATDLVSLASEVTNTFAVQAARAGVELKFEEGGPVTGLWDPLRVEQIVSNLITNALKFGGSKPVSVRVREEGQNAVIEVTDHGIGIALKEQSRIFGRFERVVSTRHFGGLGLGLYIVRELAEAHGGTVTVRSEEGKGSTFTVTLPRFHAETFEPHVVH